ncbi:hypothetical protein Tco_0924823 [Tanacetum coccineum]|uniref:Uncharacterized protein n=1 Tax=Tanacetum coccineum TaxID=301880 RepID=A0ABQ5DC28_9ASTR
MHVYKIIRADGNTSYPKTFKSMLKSFDRYDLEVLHMLVMERFQDNTPEGYNLMLWGDLNILVDPEQDDDIWKNQNQWKLISWKLYETCGVHTLMVDAEQQYNLAYFFVKRIESARATPKAHIPYVMRLLALRQTRRPRSDRGKARHSVLSTSAHHNRRFSSHQGDDDEDDGASRASTPSPTTYLNSLGPLEYQQYDVPTSLKQNDDLLFECQTDLLNQTQQMHKELRGRFKSFGKALRGVFGKKKK